MTMIPVPDDEQPGLAEEWAVTTKPEQPDEPPTRDLRRRRLAWEQSAAPAGHT